MIKQTIVLKNATAQEVYDLLLDSNGHAELIGDSAEITAKEGDEFSTFGGYSTGKNLTLVPGKSIEQTWRASDWPEGHYSTIRFEFSNTDEGVRIDFTQKDLPEGTQEEFESGWDDFYWQPLKKYFGDKTNN